MKKLFFGLVCFIGLMTFASCTQEQIDEILEQKPTVEFVSGEGFISSNTSVYVDTELNFKVRIAPNSGSEAELDNIDFTITNNEGVTVFNSTPEITDPAGENTFEFSFTPESASFYTVTATVTDKATPEAKKNIAFITVDVAEHVIEGIGTFVGIINITGHVTTDEVAGYTYDDDYNIENMITTITLGAIDENNRVSGNIEIDGTPVTLYGTMEDGIITFDEFHFNKTITITVDVDLDLAMNIIGTLEDDVLTLTGTAVGSGTSQLLFVSLNAEYNGVIDGTLEKVPSLDEK